jgi:hypothetical protein
MKAPSILVGKSAILLFTPRQKLRLWGSRDISLQTGVTLEFE